MKIKSHSILLLAFSIINLSGNIATAQSRVRPNSSPQSGTTSIPYEKQQKEIEELRRSQTIEEKIEEEVDRTINEVFERTIDLINLNIGIINILLILIPTLGTLGIWIFNDIAFHRINLEVKEKLAKQIEEIQQETENQISQNKTKVDQLIQDNKTNMSNAEKTMSELENNLKQIQREFNKNLESQKKVVEDLTNEINNKIKEFQQAKGEMHQEKDRIVQELAKLAPRLSSIPDTHQPNIQEQIQELTAQLENLKLENPQLFLTTDDYLTQGDAFFFEGNYKDAIKSYDEVIKRQPESYAAWSSRGWALRRLNKYKEALTAYNKAIEINSDNHIGWYGKGNALRELEKYDDAIAAYNKSLEIKPDFFWSWFRNAICYMINENKQKALESLQKAKELELKTFIKLTRDDDKFDSIKKLKEFKHLFEE